MISKTLTAFFVLIGSTQATNPSGIKASLDISILEQAKDVYMDKLLEVVNNLMLPDINSDDGKDFLHGNHVHVSQDASNVIFTEDVANNALVLTANKLSAVYYCDSFRAHSWIFVAKGHLDVKMNTVNVGVGLKFKTQTLADGRVVPAVESVDVNVDIDRGDINI